MSRIALAIARDRADLPDLPGISRFCSRGLSILHGPAPLDAHSPGLETLQTYAATIALLHAREPILPLRFGSLHDSLAGLDDWLRVRSDEWRALLDEVEDADEMGLRILIDRPAVASTPAAPITTWDRPGTAYMDALRARRVGLEVSLEEARRVTERVRDAVGGLFRREVVEEPSPGREGLLSLTYLVPRADLERFRQAIKPLQTLSPGKLLLTGPWPPYGFTTLFISKSVDCQQ